MRMKKLKMVEKEIDKGINENARKEYNLFKKCMPHKLLKSQEYFDKQFENMKENTIDFKGIGSEEVAKKLELESIIDI